MVIVVTGAAGFIGSHLCKELLLLNHAVIGIDNFDDFYKPEIKKENIKPLELDRKFSLLKLDICSDYESLILNLKNKKVDVLIHLAARPGIFESIEHSNCSLHNNLIGTQNILQLMVQINCKKIVFASSSSVYGNTNKEFKESDDTPYLATPYSVSKKACELLTYSYHYNHRIDVLIFRLFSVFGARQRPDLVISRFSDQIFNNEPITIFGDGKSMRDYTYITDIIDGMIAGINWIMKRNNTYEIINLGSNNPVRILDVARSLFKLYDKPEKISFMPARPAEMISTHANISKGELLINFKPKIDFFTGLEQFSKWFLQDKLNYG